MATIDGRAPRPSGSRCSTAYARPDRISCDPAPALNPMRPSITSGLCVAFATLLATLANGQCNNTWSAGPNLSILNGAAVCALVFDDGTGSALYVGGTFGGAGATSLNHIGRWRGDAWEPVGQGFGGDVRYLCAFDDGTGPKLYAAGSFLSPAGGIAVWNGSTWNPLPAGPCCPTLSGGGHAAYLCCTVYDPPGPTPAGLYLGGTIAGGVVRYDATGWSTVGSGFGNAGCPFGPAQVTALAVHDAGSGPALFAGGLFTSPGNAIARWNGSSWSPLGSGLAGGLLCPGVGDLLSFDDGHGPGLYVAGTFSSAGGVPGTNAIVRWNGQSWSAVGSGFVAVNGFASASALALHDDGSGTALYAGGSFNVVGGPVTNNVARWNGTSWSALGSGLPIPTGTLTTVRDLVSFDEGNGPMLFASAYTNNYTEFLTRWGRAAPLLVLRQSGGPGSPAFVENRELIPGSEYCNVFSFETCGQPGSGPYLGLCASDPATLLDQVLTPLGTVPFHFAAAASTVSFGPYLLPPGLVTDAVSFDFTSTTLHCYSTVQRLTVQ